MIGVPVNVGGCQACQTNQSKEANRGAPWLLSVAQHFKFERSVSPCHHSQLSAKSRFHRSLVPQP
eukprot:1171752-Amphidinium_carterae.4